MVVWGRWLLCLGLLVCLGLLLWRGYCDAQPSFECPDAWCHDKTCAAIVACLEKGPVHGYESMDSFLITQKKRVDFDNTVYLLQLKGGVRGVFKPALEPAALRDSYAEVAAFRASHYLGLSFVPPTVLRTLCLEGKVMTGSVQLYVNTTRDLLEDGVFQKTLQEVPKDMLADLKIFYFVLGQWDTGAHNLLALKCDGVTHLLAIDNAGIANAQRVHYGQLPFVCLSPVRGEVKNFSFKVEVLEKPTYQSLKARLKRAGVSEAGTDFLKKLSFYKKPLHYVVHQKLLWRQFHAADGEEDLLFFKAYSDAITPRLCKALQSLNAKVVRSFFPEDAEKVYGKALFADLLQHILERRDQVLRFFALPFKESV